MKPDSTRNLWSAALGAVLFSFLLSAAAPNPRVLQIDVDQVIHPLMADVVSHAIDQAGRDGDAAVLIRLNTPGGLLTATQDIIRKIMASPVPVITFVAPSGGRAASAGFLILEAGDVAAMAPATNTGAAHPVQFSGSPMDPVMKQKIENDTAAGLRAVTQKRGRNSEVAEKAVLESKAFTEKEALDNHLIDLVAPDETALLAALNTREITRFDGRRQKLDFAGVTIEHYQMSPRERLLMPLADPNIAFILLILGALGIYVEFTHPGLVLPGVAGGILAILALMALTLLPINWAGAALIFFGLAMFVLEAKIASHGVLGVGGAIALILGATILINTSLPELRIHLLTAVVVTLPFALITTFLLRLVLRARALKVSTGAAGMIGEIGIARSDLEPEGTVFVHGEWWNAVSNAPVHQGAKVQVLGLDGLKLKVAPSDDARKATS